MIRENVLMDLGLSQNEAKVYLTLLDLGLSTATKISYECKVHRTNVYEALERLIEKGLAKYIIKNKKKCFEASSPTNLMNILKEKQIQLQEIMPHLLLKENLKQKATKANMYEGIKSFRLILYGLLKYEKPILVFGIPKDVPEKVSNFITMFHKERIKRKILMKHIYNHDVKERVDFLNDMPYTQAKRLSEEYDSHVSTLTCYKKVFLIIWHIDPILIVEIEHKELADSYNKYFDIMWNIAK